MTHTDHCASAKSPPNECECECGGAFHGGVHSGLIFSGNFALEAEKPENDANLSAAPKPTHGGWDPKADLRTVVQEITDWLASNPTIKEQADAFAETVGERTVEILNQYGHSASRRQLTVNHFLCALLAEFAHAIDEFRRQLDKVPDRVISLIADGRKNTLFDDVVIRVLVRTAWGLIMKLPVFGQIDMLLYVVRVAAIMVCPEPDGHEEVVRYCVYPLAEKVVSAATLRRLKEIIPPSWMA